MCNELTKNSITTGKIISRIIRDIDDDSESNFKMSVAVLIELIVFERNNKSPITSEIIEVITGN